MLLLAALVTTSALLLLPRPAPAKEHSAACFDLSRFVNRLRMTVAVAAYQRSRGSSLAAYQVLRANAAALARQSERDGCGTLTGTLSSALRSSALSRTALDASVELELGLENALSLAIEGKRPHRRAPPKLPPIAEASVYGTDCPDLFPIVMRLDAGTGELANRVAAVLGDLRESSRCPRVRELLEHATSAGGTSPDRLAHAVDSLRLDEPNTHDEGDPNPAARCPELPEVADRLTSAIAVGAPLFNAGDAAGCRRTYEETARTLMTDVIRPGRCPVVRRIVTGGLSGAARAMDASDAAWALRRSFDAILSGKDAASK